MIHISLPDKYTTDGCFLYDVYTHKKLEKQSRFANNDFYLPLIPMSLSSYNICFSSSLSITDLTFVDLKGSYHHP